jgi:Fe-S oxidoreductase
MTRLRAELLQQYYDQHGTPLRTALVARLSQIEQLGRVFRPLYNFAARWKPTASLIKHIVRFAPERSIPQLSRLTMRQLGRELKDKRLENKEKRKVYLYADEFTNQQEAELGLTFAKLLMRLGYEVEIPDLLESGRAAISKGCLKRARKIAEENVKRLIHSDIHRESSYIVGIEPSAILTFRDEYPDLVPAGMRSDALRIAKKCLLYDEFLKQEIDNGHISVEDFKSDEMEIWLHGHCHQKALVGIEDTVKAFSLLRGAKVHVIPSGCCGMAGSFGYEKEHYKTSLAIGEMILFPTIRKVFNSQLSIVNSNTPIFVAAPGTSCRQQILDGTGVHAVHPIEILYNYTTSSQP